MSLAFRPFAAGDRAAFARMARQFYAPPAVLHAPPEHIMLGVFDDVLGGGRRLLGYLFEDNGQPVGYAVVSLKYETEVGGDAAWIEELFVDEAARGQGAGTAFFAFLARELHGKIRRIRLEVGAENADARRLYTRLGFVPLAYEQLVLDRDF
ncbi:MAG: GNAT family N-acetyltransferase [Clostridia bacterium]|nr:GNAT family N-acetyltransferase [Clostridia bacterium]